MTGFMDGRLPTRISPGFLFARPRGERHVMENDAVQAAHRGGALALQRERGVAQESPGGVDDEEIERVVASLAQFAEHGVGVHCGLKVRVVPASAN
jgi:hypothetical protein